MVERFDAVVTGGIEAGWDSLNNTLTAEIDSGSFRSDEAIDIVMSIKIGHDGSILYVNASAILMPYWSEVTAYIVPADIKDVNKHQVVKEAYLALKTLEEIDNQINFDSISQLILSSIGYTEVVGLYTFFDTESSNAIIEFDSAIYNNIESLSTLFEIDFLNKVSVVSNNIDYQSNPIIEYAFQAAIFSMQQLHENNTPVSMESLINDIFVDEDNPVDLDVSVNFKDTDTDDQLSYSAVLENGLNLPDWLIIDQSTGIFQGTPTNNDVGFITVKASATDTIGTSASDSFILTVNPSNDAAVISIEDTTIVENISTVTGFVTHTDIDINNNDSVFQVVTDIIASYGTYSVQTNGNWTYHLDNANISVDALNTGETLTDSISVIAEDGTTKDIIITITGENDAATVSFATTELVETDDVLTASGVLTAYDIDNADNVFIAATVEGGYGSLTIDIGGNWNYTANSEYNDLAKDDVLTDVFTVYSVDETLSTITINIIGTEELQTTVIIHTPNNDLLDNTVIQFNTLEGNETNLSLLVTDGLIDVSSYPDFEFETITPVSDSIEYSDNLNIWDLYGVLGLIDQTVDTLQTHSADMDNNNEINQIDLYKVLDGIGQAPKSFDLVDQQTHQLVTSLDIDVGSTVYWNVVANGDVNMSGEFLVSVELI